MASFFALSLVAAACGDDGDDSTTEGDDPDTTEEGAPPEEEECPEGIYQKDGVCLSLTWQTVAGNARREAIQALVIPQLEELGIQVTADNTDAGTLFEQRLPQRQTEIMLYANVASPDPSPTGNWACQNVPSEDNGFAGANNQGWCNEEATELMAQADAALDEADRVDLMHQIGDLMREDAIGLPMYQLPLITVWNTDIVTPPEDDYTTSPYSGFGNMYDLTSVDGSGTVTLGAEQWAECINAYTQCASASWLMWSVSEHVLPRLMEVDLDGNYVPSPVLAGDPELSGPGFETGEGEFTVTYTFAPEAVWDDGSEMGCADVAFSQQAKLESTGIYANSGYDLITGVEPVGGDNKVCAVTFESPYASWPDLFGGGLEFFLKAAAFPDGPDISTAMADSIGFSGGPWLLESWTPTEASFVPNEAYWDADRAPELDRVIIVPIEETETSVNAFLANEVGGIYPQPSPGIREQLAADNIDVRVGAGTTFEGIWFSNQSLLDEASPLYDQAVREALLFAIDRETILTDIIHPEFPEFEQLNCHSWVPTVGDWCDQTDFEDVTFDPDRVAEILEADGWTRG